MALVIAEESAEFDGAAEVVYGILADYRQGHPSILPKPYFTHLHVEEGGRGAGTVIRMGMRIGGKYQEAVADISEPEPGRVLEERIRDQRGTTTTFIVEPTGPGRVRVTIRTTWEVSGVAGLIERLLAPGMLRRVYRAELANLAQAVKATTG
ncbi:MAG TPA: SRPBCC family protein [Longimicrobiales bacterium]|nr:SRPBCC family protein [Longimicrobiales bacterium]